MSKEVEEAGTSSVFSLKNKIQKNQHEMRRKCRRMKLMSWRRKRRMRSRRRRRKERLRKRKKGEEGRREEVEKEGGRK